MTVENEQVSMQSLRFLAAGAIAGAVSRTIAAPIERMKIVFQLQRTNEHIIPAFRAVVKNEGIMALFKGNGANVVRVLPYQSSQFVSYEYLKQVVQSVESGSVQPLSTAGRLLAGSLAGIISVVVSYPLDVVRCRLAAPPELNARPYRGITDCLVSIGKQEGFRGLYRGVAPTIFGIAPYASINLAMYERLKSRVATLFKDGNVPVVMRLFLGGVAGVTAQTVTYPFDTIRRRMQMGAQNPKFAYSSTWNAFSTVVATEGVKGLYRGLVLNYAKAVPVVSVSFIVYEMCKDILGVKGKSGEL